MTTDPTPPTAVHAGEVLELEESEYLYGLGRLKIRVTADVPLPRGRAALTRVIGTQVNWDGAERPRVVDVMASALIRHAMRHRKLNGTVTRMNDLP